MIILFSGTRYAGPQHRTRIEQTINAAITAHGTQQEPVTVIVGDARGVDALVRDIAAKRGWTTAVFTADWNRYGRSAGPRRNKEMVDAWIAHNDDNKVFLAFPSTLYDSKGTANTIALVRSHSGAENTHVYINEL